MLLVGLGAIVTVAAGEPVELRRKPMVPVGLRELMVLFELRRDIVELRELRELVELRELRELRGTAELRELREPVELRELRKGIEEVASEEVALAELFELPKSLLNMSILYISSIFYCATSWIYAPKTAFCFLRS